MVRTPTFLSCDGFSAWSVPPVTNEAGTTLADTLGEPDTGYELADLHLTLGPAVAGLDRRERKIIGLRSG